MMITDTHYIGKPVSRVDGRAKVTGQAKYAAEFNPPGLAYGVVVSGSIAKGRIVSIDTISAIALDGVLRVFTHENVPALAVHDISYKDMDAPSGSPFRYLQTDKIAFSQQPVALVVAETFELARYAATLVRVEYKQEDPVTSLRQNLAQVHDAEKPTSKGRFSRAFAQSHFQLEAEYYHGGEHHNPLEMYATTVEYKADGKLTVYDKTQGVVNSKHYIKNVFGLPGRDVEVLSPFVGGAFGSGLRPQPNLLMAVLAALELKRSVSVVLTRQQMFSCGHRPATLQKIALGASPDGELNALSHTAIAETSRFEEYAETVTDWSGKLYKCPNIYLRHQLVNLDMFTPLDMRAPGAVTGLFALESAMDELSYKLAMDPLQLRLKNYTDEDGLKKKPYTSKALRSCYEQGAEKFGWPARNPMPRSETDGHLLTGWGMATGIWTASFKPCRARAIFTADGKLTVGSATADIGTGTYTIMTQIAAETLGLPLEDVTFKLGDTSLPFAGLVGDSATAASVGTAVQKVCLQVKEKLFTLAKDIAHSPFADTTLQGVIFSNCHIILKDHPTVTMPVTEVMRSSGTNTIKETSTALPRLLKQLSYAKNTHSAVFAEVKVDEELGVVKVTRVVSAIAAGRIINLKTARSQVLGGIIWGISQALFEDSVMDHRFGRFMNHNLADYHIPVHLDTPDMEVIFVEEEDHIVNPLGVKGVGEIGSIGVAAAIANAVFHATGKRVRELPITLDKLL